jgi:hypothetical protein
MRKNEEKPQDLLDALEKTSPKLEKLLSLSSFI